MSGEPVPSFHRTCVHCDMPMGIKDHRGIEERFYGILRCPKCGYEEPLPIDLSMLMQGAPKLPGFDTP